MSFKSYGLSAELLRAINDQGYTNPTPIQQKAIPLLSLIHISEPTDRTRSRMPSSA